MKAQALALLLNRAHCVHYAPEFGLVAAWSGRDIFLVVDVESGKCQTYRQSSVPESYHTARACCVDHLNNYLASHLDHHVF